MVEMCFHNHDASLASWDYVEAAEEPLRTLQVAVNSKVQDSLFVLYRDTDLNGPNLSFKHSRYPAHVPCYAGDTYC